jgi:RNA polymerase sigma-70 factor (ECF subfamily)
MDPVRRSDEELLAAWQASDQAAGRELFGRHFDSVYRFFRNKVSDAAEDLTQLTFMGCLKARDRFRGESSFRTYLFGIARNQLCTYLRDRTRRDRAIEPGYESVADILGPTATAYTAQREEEHLLLKALRKLPLEMQEALELHYWEDMTVREISEVTGTPEGTIKRRLQRGRERLDELIAQLAESKALLESTMSDLDGWAKKLREKLLPNTSAAIEKT